MTKIESLPTQQIVEISEIKEDGTIILKNGGLRRILMVSGLNFELKSEEEQGYIIHNYQRFLNTLDFSLQTVVRSRRLNIGDYLESLSERKGKELNELLKNLMDDYIGFVRSFVENSAVAAKTFFVVIPYDPVQIAPPAQWKVFSFLKKGGEEEEKKKKEALAKNFENNVFQLNQRVAQTAEGLAQIGLRAVPLNARESLELIYNFYNPETIEKKRLKIAEEL